MAASKWRPKFHAGDTTGKSIFCNPLAKWALKLNEVKIVHSGQLYCNQSKVKSLMQLSLLTQCYFLRARLRCNSSSEMPANKEE
jgi:hypothetical protein